MLEWKYLARANKVHQQCCSRSQCEGSAPAPNSTLDKTEKILNDILSVRFNIKCLPVLKN